jgi:hypothetical protein
MILEVEAHQPGEMLTKAMARCGHSFKNPRPGSTRVFYRAFDIYLRALRKQIVQPSIQKDQQILCMQVYLRRVLRMNGFVVDDDVNLIFFRGDEVEAIIPITGKGLIKKPSEVDHLSFKVEKHGDKLYVIWDVVSERSDFYRAQIMMCWAVMMPGIMEEMVQEGGITLPYGIHLASLIYRRMGDAGGAAATLDEGIDKYGSF